MRYSCDDIKYYLEHGDLNPENESEFINHIENCLHCGRMVNPESELEEMLAVLTPQTSPLSFEKDVLAQIQEYEKEHIKSNRLEKAVLPVFIFFSALPLFLVAWFWRDIRSFFSLIDLDDAYSRLQSAAAEIPIPKIDLAGIAAAISNSPLVILSLIAITALIWAFSIIEAQKALK